MRRLKLTKELQERFLEALADTGSVSTAVAVAGTSRTRVYELRGQTQTKRMAPVSEGISWSHCNWHRPLWLALRRP